jgi:Ca2+-binding RTX toxin-like protein
VVLAGSGNDTLVAGAGAATLTAGAGTTTFVFFQGSASAGSTDIIADFSSSDSLILAGYSAGEAAAALNNAVSAAGSTTLTLSDSTQITFLGVSSASALLGHVV